jgi:hypothetical protein
MEFDPQRCQYCGRPMHPTVLLHDSAGQPIRLPNGKLAWDRYTCGDPCPRLHSSPELLAQSLAVAKRIV